MKLIFMGTPKFALPTLNIIHRNYDLRAIITQPDKPKGRHLHLSASPVKEYGLKNKIRLIQPATLINNDTLNKIIEDIDPDAIVVAAYGRIMPDWMLKLPKYGCLNLHASLLPQYRGAAPIQRAIMDGKAITGVSTMKVAPTLDTGDIYLQSVVEIAKDDNYESLSNKLAIKGAELVLETLEAVFANNIVANPQDEAKAGYAEKITKDEMVIDWKSDYKKISYLIRALAPRPGAQTIINNKKVKIIAAETRSISGYPPKAVVSLKNELIIAAKNGAIALQIVIPEGKRQMSGADYARGSGLNKGEMI